MMHENHMLRQVDVLSQFLTRPETNEGNSIQQYKSCLHS